VVMDKHNRPDYLLWPLKVKSFNYERLDTVLHIKTYIDKTQTLRASQRLFVITTRPYTVAVKGMLSRWISDIITCSGQARKGGSCRSAGPIKVNTSHLLLELILEAGEWSIETTFSKFYCNTTNMFASVVLEAEEAK